MDFGIFQQMSEHNEWKLLRSVVVARVSSIFHPKNAPALMMIEF